MCRNRGQKNSPLRLIYLELPNRISAISRSFLEKNFLSAVLISTKSLLAFKFPTNSENPDETQTTRSFHGLETTPPSPDGAPAGPRSYLHPQLWPSLQAAFLSWPLLSFSQQFWGFLERKTKLDLITRFIQKIILYCSTNAEMFHFTHL